MLFERSSERSPVMSLPQFSSERADGPVLLTVPQS